METKADTVPSHDHSTPDQRSDGWRIPLSPTAYMKNKRSGQNAAETHALPANTLTKAGAHGIMRYHPTERTACRSHPQATACYAKIHLRHAGNIRSLSVLQGLPIHRKAGVLSALPIYDTADSARLSD